jgi:hypothetical protein
MPVSSQAFFMHGKRRTQRDNSHLLLFIYSVSLFLQHINRTTVKGRTRQRRVPTIALMMMEEKSRPTDLSLPFRGTGRSPVCQVNATQNNCQATHLQQPYLLAK